VNASPRIVLCAGELSGDMHAAHVVSALRERIPGVTVTGMAGAHCRAAGMDVRHEHRDYAVIGFTGVLSSLPRFALLEREIRRLIDSCDVVSPVESPGLNLRLCAYAHARGRRVLYYIAPQVWAWGAGRVQKMKRSVDRVAVVLPFEAQIYREAGIPVEYVGHPFVTDHELPSPRPAGAREWVALLPGSRQGEVRSILPVLADAAAELARRRGGLRFVIGKSPVVDADVYHAITRGRAAVFELHDDAVEVLAGARAAMVASGTATLQSALLDTPLVIVYRTGALNYAIARRLVRIPHVGLVNVLLGAEVAPEFVQDNARADRIAAAVERIFTDEVHAATMRAGFAVLRADLGRGEGSVRVAAMAAELLP
jgi:lipid-A-disaccharide synthase